MQWFLCANTCDFWREVCHTQQAGEKDNVTLQFRYWGSDRVLSSKGLCQAYHALGIIQILTQSNIVLHITGFWDYLWTSLNARGQE